MLIGYILLGIFVVCTLFSPVFGSSAELGSAVMSGAQEAVSFCISIAGSICLWSGVMELMARCGISAGLAKLLKPLLSRLFPRTSKHEEILSAISENVSANLLGLGNAATPAGIRAAQGMARLDSTGSASNELCLFVVINTASIQLLPSTIASVRAAEGAASAFDIMPAVWISSVISVCAGLLAASVLKKLWA